MDSPVRCGRVVKVEAFRFGSVDCREGELIVKLSNSEWCVENRPQSQDCWPGGLWVRLIGHSPSRIKHHTATPRRIAS